MTHDARFLQLGITLPPAPKPVATYMTAVRHERLLFISGHGPLKPEGGYVVGKLGATLDLAGGKAAARLTGLAVLATLQTQLGSLDRVVRVIKILGMVNSTPDFVEHPQVIDGFSDLMVEVFGTAGLAARSAIGTASLPAGIAVEVEAVFEIKE